MSKEHNDTIGISTYNVQHYIRRCLESALNQQFQGYFEISITDDCGIDSSLDIVKEIISSDCKSRLYSQAESHQSDHLHHCNNKASFII